MGLFDRIKKAFSAEPEKETPVEQDQAIPETPVESDATPVESQTLQKLRQLRKLKPMNQPV